jgi:hypothetical protein
LKVGGETMLFHEREQQREFEEKEREGQPIWTSEIASVIRNKIIYLLKDIGLSAMSLEETYARTQRILERRTGFILGNGLFPVDDVVTFLVKIDEKYFLSGLEAIYISLNEKSNSLAGIFEIGVTQIFSQERISYDMISGQIVSFSSRELHAEIVEPVLRLLGGLSGWEEVETTYQKALREIGVDPGDAITDATTALQVTLTKLGCNGNSLGPLTQSAVKMGLLAPHDKNLLDWLSADRSSTGDAHKASSADPSDAWIVVHVAGALILRLANGGLRGAK